MNEGRLLMKRLRPTPALGLTLTILVSLVFVGTSYAQTGTISGYVYDNATGEPLAGVEITIGNDDWPPTSSVYTTTTNAAGYYQLTGLPAATDYTVLASAVGYASQNVIMQQPPASVHFYLDAPDAGLLVETINEGLIHYACDAAYCYRTTAGEVQEDDYFFPNIEAQNSTITTFMLGIGAGTDPTTDDAQIWQKAATTWNWLQSNNYYNPSDSLWSEAITFMNNYNDGWPSIEAIAVTYNTYGFLPWGTCMSRAQIYTTLLYRTGIPKDRLAIEELRWRLRYSQHMATILYISNRWVYLDPSFIGLSFPPFADFHSIPHGGLGSRDYEHPLRVIIIPDSNIAAVPEVTDRSSNSPNVLIISPPNGTHTLVDNIDVTGMSENGNVTQVSVNGTTYLVTAGSFAANVYLPCGDSTITAQVVDGATYTDSVSVYRWCTETASMADVSITGPASGNVQASYTFTATIEPVAVMRPITYVWQAPNLPSITHTTNLRSDSVNFTLDTAGPQDITVTATNSDSSVADSHRITLFASAGIYVYLPIILREP
jgi:hypothetical protein